MQKTKTLLLISAILFVFNPAIAQGPPVPMGPKKLQEQKIKTEVHEVRQQPAQSVPVQQKPAQIIQTENTPKEQNEEEIKVKEKSNNEVTKKPQKRPIANKSILNKEKKQNKSQTPKQESKLQNNFKNLTNKIKKTKSTEDKTEIKKTKEQEKQQTKQNRLNKKEQTNNEALPKSIKTKEQPKTLQEQKSEIQSSSKQNESQSTSINPSQINDAREQAKFLYNSNKLEEAQRLFNQIPDSEKISDDWLFLANIAQDNDKPIDAVFLLKKAIAADDNNYKAHYNLGNLYFYDNKINMAMSEYKKAIRLKKNFAYAYYNKGCC